MEPTNNFEFLVSPQPFAEALQKANQVVVGSLLSSAEQAEMPLAFRENAMFSAGVIDLRILNKVQDFYTDFLAGNRVELPNGKVMLATGSRAAFISQMQEYLDSIGTKRTSGDLKDITSAARLGLIFDVKTRQAQDYGYFRQGMNPAVLNAFPAQRFIRVREVKTERLGHIPFENQVYLKTDPIWWLEINRDFGVPWGPFGWGCGHDVEDVDRDEAEHLGLIKPGQQLHPLKKFFNENLQANVSEIHPELLAKFKEAFGDQIVIEDGIARWRGQTAGQPGDTVTSRDLAAIRDYTATTGLADTLNAALRTERAAAPADMQLAADALTAAVAKLPVFAGEVYRGALLSDTELAAAARRYLPGNVVTEDAFTSASADRGMAFPGNLRFEIRSKAGRRLDDFSTVPDEREVLFDQGTQFRVVAARWHGGALHVTLEEL